MPQSRVLLRIVVAEVRAAAFLALERRAGDDLGNRQQIVQIEGRVPAGVVLAIPGDARLGRARPSAWRSRRAPAPFRPRAARCPPGPASCPASSCWIANGFSPAAPRSNGSSACSRGCVHLSQCRSCPAPWSLANFAAYSPGALAEDQQIGKRIAAQAIGAVQSRRAFPGGEQAGHGRHLRSASTRTPPIM